MQSPKQARTTGVSERRAPAIDLTRLATRAERRWRSGQTADSPGPAPATGHAAVVAARPDGAPATVTAVVTVDPAGRLPLAAAAAGGVVCEPGNAFRLRVENGVLVARESTPGDGGRISAVRLDGRGRLLVPPGIRHLARIRPGDRVVVIVTDDGSEIRVVSAGRAAAIILGQQQRDEQQEEVQEEKGDMDE
jgi:bifunctional DNA-binding transcriptional regulator/antitoxin component of YhaV-PrlF toxin-antitoxin module